MNEKSKFPHRFIDPHDQFSKQNGKPFSKLGETRFDDSVASNDFTIVD